MLTGFESWLSELLKFVQLSPIFLLFSLKNKFNLLFKLDFLDKSKLSKASQITVVASVFK